VEPNGEAGHVLELLGALAVEGEESFKLLFLFGVNLNSVPGLHDNRLEDGLECVHVGVLPVEEHNGSSPFLVHLSLGLSEFLAELLFDNFADMSSVVLHEQVSVAVGASIENDGLVLILEALLDQLVNHFLLGGPLIEHKVAVALSDSHEWDLDQVFLPERLFDLSSLSSDLLGLPHEKYQWGEDRWVLLFLFDDWLSDFCLLLDIDPAFDSLDLQFFWCFGGFGFRERGVALASHLGSVLV